MAKFLFRAQYSPQGLQGAVKEGFGNREDYIRGLIETVGGTTEAWYFSYGLEDLVVIVDAEPAAALALNGREPEWRRTAKHNTVADLGGNGRSPLSGAAVPRSRRWMR